MQFAHHLTLACFLTVFLDCVFVLVTSLNKTIEALYPRSSTVPRHCVVTACTQGLNTRSEANKNGLERSCVINRDGRLKLYQDVFWYILR